MNTLFSAILVGVDDAEPSRQAVSLAARLAREHDGRLILCHSVNWLSLVAQTEASGVYIDPTPIIDGMKEQGEALLAEAAAIAKGMGIDAERRNVEGEPAENLLKTAADERCSLILMGTHGRRGVGRFFIGSTTESVLRASTIPVLTLRPGEKIAPAAHHCFERIVVGVDDSEPSDAAIKTIVELPAADRRHVTFCAVADLETVIGAYGYHYVDIQESLHQQAQRTIDRAIAAARANNVEADGFVIEGRTREELLAAAKSENADLVVLGSHGRRGVRRFFLGSVAEGIVRSSHVPVLVVRSVAPAQAPVVTPKRDAAAV